MTCLAFLGLIKGWVPYPILPGTWYPKSKSTVQYIQSCITVVQLYSVRYRCHTAVPWIIVGHHADA
jgi:hypothetical protein